MRYLRLCGISVRFQTLFPSTRQVAHALLTRPPLTHFPKETRPFDLNVLCTPPAFILSQDQTLVLFLSYLLPLKEASIKSSSLFLLFTYLKNFLGSHKSFCIQKFVVVVQFSRSFVLLISRRQPKYNNTLNALCQHFFSVFFTIFFPFFRFFVVKNVHNAQKLNTITNFC